MRACALTSLFGGAAVCALGAFVGCGGSANAPAAAPTTETASPSSPEPATTDAPAASSASAEPAASSVPAPADADDSSSGETRTMEVIAEVVKAHRKPARECYEKQLKQIPDLKGDLVIHFTLRPNGTVKTAEINTERSTITAPPVVNCVIDVIRGIQFPRSSRGMETTVNYPFNFNPS
jgi:hypothetical protein